MTAQTTETVKIDYTLSLEQPNYVARYKEELKAGGERLAQQAFLRGYSVNPATLNTELQMAGPTCVRVTLSAEAHKVSPVA